jgi:hypothetical protein
MTSAHQPAPANPWRTSSYCDTGGQCVQVTQAGTTVAVRDSTNPHAALLTFTPQAWTAFLRRLSQGKNNNP